ncbi:Uncharacterised protein [Mycobacteroides abscessus subsp. massiliense]|nr:Uncharacterised protein [Mycobacteroides abscessus subsp. massiliense]
MHVVHGSEEREVVLALDDSKGEASPFQWARYVDDVAAYFIDRHMPLCYRRELDFAWIADGVPYERPVLGALEPAAEGVMPPQVCVEGMVHRGDVALARDIAAGDYLAREV